MGRWRCIPVRRGQNVRGFGLGWTRAELAGKLFRPSGCRIGSNGDAVEIAGALDFGSALNSFQFRVSGLSTKPVMRRSQVWDQPGDRVSGRDSKRRDWPGGNRPSFLQFLELSAVIAFEQHKVGRRSSLSSPKFSSAIGLRFRKSFTRFLGPLRSTR
jgi:hypothetical protein